MNKINLTTIIALTLLLCQYATEASSIKNRKQSNVTQNPNEIINVTFSNVTATNSNGTIGEPKNITVLKLISSIGDGHLIFGDINAINANATPIGNVNGITKGNFSTFQMFKELPLVRDGANKNQTAALLGTSGAAADITLTNKDGTLNQSIKMSTMQSTMNHANVLKVPHTHTKRLHPKMHRDNVCNRRHAHRLRHMKNTHLLEDKTSELAQPEFPERHFGIDFIQGHNGNRKIEVDADIGANGKALSPLSITKMFNLANFLLGDVDPIINRPSLSCGTEEFTFGNKPQAPFEFSRSARAQPKNFMTPLGSQEVDPHCPVHNGFGSLAKDIFGICTCGIVNI